MDGVVIIGAGQAGYQTAASLRAEGYDGSIALIGEEPHVPYQRPPLSKAFVLGKQDQTRVLLRPASYYADHKIELLSGERATAIERTTRQVLLKSGRRIRYSKLVLALGARNRALPIPGAELDGVRYLRTLGEAVEIKQRLEQAQSVAVIGGGFVGLEIAAAARALGKPVTVLEALPRLMARAVAPATSEFVHAVHAAQGTRIMMEARVRQIRGDSGKARAVALEEGEAVEADLVIIGVGIVPNTDLAEQAGLTIENGIATDTRLKTADENIFAAGDCAQYPSAFAGSRVRLESVQNAVDHGVCIARNIAGKAEDYKAVPWFWSDQFDMRLQMAGLSAGADRSATRGDQTSGKFSVFHFRGEKLCAVESVNRPADHIAARKLLASGAALTPEQAADENFNLKTA